MLFSRHTLLTSRRRAFARNVEFSFRIFQVVASPKVIASCKSISAKKQDIVCQLQLAITRVNWLECCQIIMTKASEMQNNRILYTYLVWELLKQILALFQEPELQPTKIIKTQYFTSSVNLCHCKHIFRKIHYTCTCTRVSESAFYCFYMLGSFSKYIVMSGHGVPVGQVPPSISKTVLYSDRYLELRTLECLRISFRELEMVNFSSTLIQEAKILRTSKTAKTRVKSLYM